MAGFFPESWIQELLDKNDIVDVISGYVDLKQKGGRFWGCCPFHHEKTASFNVDVNKQFFYCFGCGQGGNVIHFLMKHDHLTFVEAVEFLASRVNLPLPSRVDSDAERQKQEAKKKHYDMHKEAARFYVHNLVANKGPVIAYVKKRGIKPDFVKKFGIGYAPDAKDKLYQLLKKQGFSAEEMIASGLIKKSSSGIVDVFRNRLMFPIIDVYGNVVAFGGRVLDDSLPKYVNSADSSFYNKRRHLYGLHLAKSQRNLTSFVLVEGYMDVVTLSSAGVQGVVASLGTSLTGGQANLIKRFVSKVNICYDGDAAGQKAALRASEILGETGIGVRIVDLPGKQDPDDFLKANGIDQFEALIDKALLPHQFEVERLAERYQLGDENQRRDFALAALQIVAKCKNTLDKEDMISYLEVKTGYSKDVLTSQQLSIQKETEKKQEVSNQKKRPPAPKKIAVWQKAEQGILKMALNGFYNRLISELKEEDFTLPFHREVYALLKEAELNENQLLMAFQDEEQAGLAMQIVTSMPEVKDQAFDDCKKIIEKNRLQQQYEQMRAKLSDKELSRDQRAQVMASIAALQKSLKE